MEIRAFGDSGRQRECERCIRAHAHEAIYKRLILLPIPTSRDGVHINGTDVRLDSLYSAADPDTLVVGYDIPPPLATALSGTGAHVYDAGLDERFLCENAELTARGALGHILCAFPRDVSELDIAIIGYGRIGSRLLRYLLFLGARPTVITGRESVRKELLLAGVRARCNICRGDLSEYDLIVNTAPAPLICDGDIAGLRDGAKIMDLASGSFVPSFPGMIKLSSIPERMYPLSAGGVYAKYISEYLFDNRESTEE